MAYRSTSRRKSSARRSSYSSRGRVSRRAPVRRTARSARGRSARPQTVRIVIEQPAASPVARPGEPVGIGQMIASAAAGKSRF